MGRWSYKPPTQLRGARRSPAWARGRWKAAIGERVRALPGFAPQTSREICPSSPHPCFSRGLFRDCPPGRCFKSESLLGLFVCLGAGYLREHTVGVINAPATFLPTCCRSRSAASLPRRHHAPPSPSSSSPSLPSGASLFRIPKFRPGLC